MRANRRNRARFAGLGVIQKALCGVGKGERNRFAGFGKLRARDQKAIALRFGLGLRIGIGTATIEEHDANSCGGAFEKGTTRKRFHEEKSNLKEPTGARAPTFFSKRRTQTPSPLKAVMSTTFRSDRAAEAIRMAVSRALREEISDPSLQNVTITRVEVTHDLSFARVFYTVLGGADERSAAQLGFDRAAPFLRSKIGENVPLRTVPDIGFKFDKGVENQMRMDEIFASLPELQGEKASGTSGRGAEENK